MSHTAELLVKQQKINKDLLEKIKGHGPGGLIMKSDILEIVNDIPQEQRFHHLSIHPKNLTILPKEEKKPEKKEIKFIEETNTYKDIAITNIRRVIFISIIMNYFNFGFIFLLILYCFLTKKNDHSYISKVIAERLTESKTTIPHYYLSVALKMDKLMNFRKKINDATQTKISVNDIFIKAAALAIKRIPEINTQWGGQFVRNFKNIDISVAVSTESGLITPIVFGADQKSFAEISKNMKELAEKAKNNKLKPQEFQVCLFFSFCFGLNSLRILFLVQQS